jgi:hypothetical protein
VDISLKYIEPGLIAEFNTEVPSSKFHVSSSLLAKTIKEKSETTKPTGRVKVLGGLYTAN